MGHPGFLGGGGGGRQDLWCSGKRGGFGVKGGRDVGCAWLRGGFFFLQNTHDQVGDGAAAFLRRAYFGARGEDAEGGVDGDLFYGFGCGCGFALGFGEVEAGDLEAVEEEAGAAGVDFVGGDALQDFADGGLDGGAVFRQGQVEGGAAASALFWISDWAARGVVVVAEFF